MPIHRPTLVSALAIAALTAAAAFSPPTAAQEWHGREFGPQMMAQANPGETGPGQTGPGQMQGRGPGGQNAQGPRGPRAQGDRASRREAFMKRMADRRFQLLDTNHDGKISVAEITAEEKRLFGAADFNGDGKISVDEYRRRGGWFLQLGTTSFFDMLHADGDGQLTLAELTAPTARWFKRHDADKNGGIDAAEISNRGYYAAMNATPEREARIKKRGERRVRLFDANNDKKVSLAEFQAEEKRLFTAADVNGDGKLSPEEFSRRGRWFVRLGAMSFFDMMDANGDGTLSVTEVTAPSERWFKRHDTDKSGTMDVNEYIKARSDSGPRGRRR